jgi:signal transduction histidine kinase
MDLGRHELRLSLWNRATGQLEHHVANADTSPTAFAEEGSGRLWIGFHDGGLVRYQGGRFEPLAVPPGAIAGPINALHIDQGGRLWIASTQSGVLRVDDPGSAHPLLARYTTSQGLSSNEILCLTEDEKGRIYAGTNRGVDRLDPTSGLVRHYTTADGLSRGAVGHAYRDHLGVLWFLTDEGISRLTSSPDPAPVPPPVIIAGLRVRGVPRPISELGETQVGQLELAPDQNQVQIEFVGLDFEPGAALQYQYKLEGEDQDWSALSSERTVNYASLAPGSYRFLVRAVSADGIISRTPATIAFTVLAPVWRRWWFLSLCALLAAGAVYGLYQYRLGQLLAVERIRTRIATDLHDDIGSSLSQVAILSEVVRRRIPDSDPEIHEPLSRIAGVSRELVDSMSDIVWAINPAKDRVYFLAQRMREFASDVFIAGDIQLQFRAEISDHDLKVGAEVRRQVFLIFKECIHNIVRHSNCTQVEIGLRVEGGRLVIEVRDNGIGFEPVAAVPGHGLESMRARAQRLGGGIHVAADHRGTAVTLEIPLAATLASSRSVPPPK